jgi:hypothetical protein
MSMQGAPSKGGKGRARPKAAGGQHGRRAAAVGTASGDRRACDTVTPERRAGSPIAATRPRVRAPETHRTSSRQSRICPGKILVSDRRPGPNRMQAQNGPRPCVDTHKPEAFLRGTTGRLAGSPPSLPVPAAAAHAELKVQRIDDAEIP